MPSLFRRRAVTTAACTVLVLAPASAAPALAVETAAADETTISILSFNDFHGALSADYIGTQFADTVEDYRTAFEAEHGAGSTLLTSAGDLIAEAALAIEMGADAEDIGLTIHPHPTLSETMGMAAEAFEGTITDLYMPKRK